MYKKKVIELIFSAVGEINKRLPENGQIEQSIKTVLFGENGKLDSLGLVNLIVAIEQNIEDEFEQSIIIADERAMSQKRSPFRTIDSLADYIDILMQENQISM